MKLFSILPILISGQICLLDHLTKSCQQKFEPSFCNGNGGNTAGRCIGDSPRLLNLDYTCVLEDNGQVRVKFSLADDVSDDLQDKIIFANKLADFQPGFSEVKKLAKGTTELLLAEHTAKNVGGVKTLYATIGTIQTAPKTTPFGSGKPDYGDNYKIECKVRTGSAPTTTKPTTIIPTTTPLTTPHECICPTTAPTTTTTTTATTTATRPPTVSYKVKVSTSSRFWSGTDDTVYIELVSEFGTSGMKRVSSDLKIGSTVTASLTAPYYGDLKKIVLFKGGKDGWRLKNVHVEYTVTDENGIRRTNKYVSEGYSILEESNPVVVRTPTKL